ncbi:transglycosylase domain-containing protein [Streptomyces anandii]|uniref:transglycosylase domain-containing protein n=1 Tax=Streptomyces anandii TaxID=285454 RepID=UPI003692B117
MNDEPQPQHPPLDGAPDTPTGATPGTGRNAGEAEDSGAARAGDVGEGPAEGAGKGAGEGPAESTGAARAEATRKGSAGKPAPGEAPAEDSVEGSDRDTAEVTGNASAKGSGKAAAAEGPGKAPAESTADAPAKSAADGPAKSPARRPDTGPAEDSTEVLSRAATQVSGNAATQLSGNPAAKPSGKPAPKPSGNANAQASGSPSAPPSRTTPDPRPAPPAPRSTTPSNAPVGGAGGGKAGRRRRTGWRRLFPTWRMVLGGFITVVLLVIGAFFLGYSLVKIPPANALAMKQANVYLYADGTEIARDGDINRENVTLDQVSMNAQHAVLAAEDRDFYTESAIDPKAMVRAAWNTATGKGRQSGSTITQQYVKNYYLGQEQTVTRKVKEFFISIKLDRNESKSKILEGYLNTSYFGRNAYGIQAAAQAYYGVKAKDLDPARAAYLAALVNAPSEYDVSAHPENKAAAVARWNYVLDGMVKQGWLSASERAGMKFPTPKEATVPTTMSGQRGYLVRAIKDYLAANKILSEDELAAGGYRITTTLQKSKQNAFVKAVDDRLMSKLDKKNRKVDTYVRAGGAAVDPKTGEVVALYGGIDYVKQYTNNATRRDFQVGSTFKPFVLTSAIQNHSTTLDGRTITPGTVYDGTNQRPVQGWAGGSYAPENEDQHSYGNITVREATDKSVNAVYAQMAVDVGPDKVRDTATALGIPGSTPDLTPTPSIALGPATASVLDMAEAYATLANHGEHGMYTILKKITKDGTDAVQLPQRQTAQAVSREAADTTTSVLRSVVQNGTATAAQGAGRPAAGKTGTAEEDTAAWFAGYTPDLATVVSVMGQDPVTAAHKSLYGAMGLPRVNGGGAPAEIWAQFTRDALEGTPATDFDLQVQDGADQLQQPPSTGPSSPTPGTGGQDNGGTPGTGTGGQDTQGQDQGQTGGQTGDTTGGTPTTGGTDGTPTTGGTGGTPTTGGQTGGNNGGTGGTPTTGGTDGGTTSGTDTGGNDAGGGQGGTVTGTSDGGTTAGTAAGPPGG